MYEFGSCFFCEISLVTFAVLLQVWRLLLSANNNFSKKIAFEIRTYQHPRMHWNRVDFVKNIWSHFDSIRALLQFFPDFEIVCRESRFMTVELYTDIHEPLVVSNEHKQCMHLTGVELCIGVNRLCRCVVCMYICIWQLHIVLTVHQYGAEWNLLMSWRRSGKINLWLVFCVDFHRAFVCTTTCI